MKSSPDVETVSQESLFLITRATVRFLKWFEAAWHNTSNYESTYWPILPGDLISLYLGAIYNVYGKVGFPKRRWRPQCYVWGFGGSSTKEGKYGVSTWYSSEKGIISKSTSKMQSFDLVGNTIYNISSIRFFLFQIKYGEYLKMMQEDQDDDEEIF